MRPVAMGSLMGHLIYGLVLGAAYVRLLPSLSHARRPLDVGSRAVDRNA